MKMLLLTFGIVFFLASSLSAAEERAFKYEEGRTATRDYEQALRKAVKEYAVAVRTARKDYADALDAALKTAMDRGDLEEANRLNAAKEAVAKELTVSYVAAISPETPAASEASPTLTGTWRYPNGTRIVFHTDGTYTRSWDRDAKPGTWRHVEGKKFAIAGDVVELSADLKSFPNPNPDGEGQVIQRVIPVPRVAESKSRN